MKHSFKFFPISIFLFLISFSVFAQEKTLTAEDAILGYYKGLYPKDLYYLQWIDNTNNYIYNTGESLIITDAESKKIIKVIDQALINLYPEISYIPKITYIDDKNLVFELHSNLEIYNYQNNTKVATIPTDEKAENKDYNAQKQTVAYTLDNNLYISTPHQKGISVTHNKDKNIVAGQSIHRNEFGITKGIFWSPKGNYLAFYQKDETNVTDYPLVDINTYPATLKNIKYPMAGQGSEKASIGVFNLQNQKSIYLDIDTSDEHYLTNLTWSPDEKYILVAEVNRDQNHYWLNRYDAQTGKKINTLFEEKNDKWVEPEYEAVFLPNKDNEFLWFSERDGFMNLYWYNLKGKLIKQLTKFKWVVTSVLGFSNDGKFVFISGTGTDPRENKTFKINLKNEKITDLTPSVGTHSTQLSSDGNYLIDSYSSLTIPHNIDIINTQNNKSYNILTAENPLKDYNVGTTEFVTLKADDGTILYGKIHKPKNFNPNKKYPVLVYVYGGPHAQLVTNSWLGGSPLWMPAFASTKDYIVFTLDNRGSANRGFDFESVIHRQLGEIEMKDQLVGIDYLKSLPYVNANRMAIHGWSFGGFMTTSLMLRHPEIFTTAVAGGAVTDWKFYEVMYGERYMDTPQQNPEGYEKAHLGNYIQNLKGNILFIHGSVDNVVVPQHIMTLLQEAIGKKTQVDFFTYPMHEHNVGGIDRAHLIQKIWDYIVKNNLKKFTPEDLGGKNK